MFKISLKIYITANLVVAFFTLLQMVTEWHDVLETLAFISSISFLFSLPALVLLCLFFYMIETYRPGAGVSWMLLLIVVGVSVVIIELLFSLFLEGKISLGFLLPLLLVAYFSVLLNARGIGRLFHNVHMEETTNMDDHSYNY